MNKKIVINILLSCICLYAEAQVNFATSGNVSGTTPATAATYINSSGIAGTLHNFNITDPTYCNGVIEGPDGKLYGATKNGGPNSRGVVFSVNADGSSFTVIYNAAANEAVQNAMPAFGPDGKIYINISDKLYRIETNGSAAAVQAVLPLNGAQITIDADGWIYAKGFDGSNWFLYKIKTDGTGYTILRTFNTNTDGNLVYNNGLCVTSTGRLYGTCEYGGVNSSGTFFSLKKDGTEFTVHKSFGTLGNGSQPASYGAPVQDNGKIFFLTKFGGTTYYKGKLFSFDTTSLVVTSLYEFPVSNTGPNCHPKTANGKLIGLNENGLYRIDEDGTNYQQLNTSAGEPELMYSAVSNQIFYIIKGGAFKNGYLSKTDATAFTTTNLHDYGNVPEGYNPAAIFKAPDGKLYGFNENGGATGGGTIFKMNSDGTGFQNIYYFTGDNGQRPVGKLLYASDGKLYGVCSRSGVSGSSNNRLIFSVNTDGSNYTVLQVFTNAAADGAVIGDLTEGTGGNLFGATGSWGDISDEPSIIFKINKNGTGYTVLKRFNINWSEGKVIRHGLTYYNGVLYGSCITGGPADAGTLFKINENGTGFSIIKQFMQGTDGGFPSGGLTLATNNKLYGSTFTGGTNYGGFVYSVDPANLSFQIVFEFDFTYGNGGADCKMFQASNGRLYKAGLNGIFGIDINGTNPTYSQPPQFKLVPNNISVAYLTEIPLTILPLRLVNFTAEKQNSTVSLAWQTQEEINTKWFEVERSLNGRNFVKLIIVNANGNTTTASHYSAADVNPASGNNYYRLKMVDNDGRITYSPIRLVNFTAANGISLYPNPTTEILQIKHGLKASQLLVTITDNLGKTILQQTLSNTPVLILGVKNLSAGSYTVSVKSDLQVYTSVFLKE